MGHRIQALVTSQSVQAQKLAEFDLIALPAAGFLVIALHANHCDAWTERLKLESRRYSPLLLDLEVTHVTARALGITRFALLETAYFGGIGSQQAVVYELDTQLLLSDSINAALRLLGVTCRAGLDEFDTLELGKYRSFERFFEGYL